MNNLFILSMDQFVSLRSFPISFSPTTVDSDDVVTGVGRNGLIMKWLKLKTLGKGSYGVVHSVKPTSSEVDQVFAVKSCMYQLSSSLQKELRILRGFAGCCNIVQCYGDMFSVEKGVGVYNLFLEYAPGGSLLDLIIKKYGGKIPERDVKCYARMLVEGVRDIHRRGYVHCDLKPENILVYPSHQYGSINRLKIADFGLARKNGKRVDWPEKEPWKLNFPGTAVYMPPESINAAKISASLDIWSLGCIVLVMTTGKLPWEYQTMTDLALLLATSTPEIPENMSSAGKDFLMKCLAWHPNERWTADMLLKHPFLLPDCVSFPSQTKSLHHARAGSYLPIAGGMVF